MSGLGEEAVRGLGEAICGSVRAHNMPGSGGLEEGGLLKHPTFCLGAPTQAPLSNSGPLSPTQTEAGNRPCTQAPPPSSP